MTGRDRLIGQYQAGLQEKIVLKQTINKFPLTKAEEIPSADDLLKIQRSSSKRKKIK